mgnify:CR=1 FL=1
MLKVNNKSGEIYIYDVIGADWYGGGITAVSVIEALDSLKGKPATIRINSPGGIADEGIAIYNALKRYEGGVTTIVDALAASAASIIALAGTTRETSQGGRWMIHRAMGLAIGNATDMDKLSEVLTKYDNSLVEIYSQYMSEDAPAIMDLLTAETWYTADEAVAAGLSTSRGAQSEAEPMVAAWFRNAPAAILNKPKAELKPESVRGQRVKQSIYSR